MEFLIRILVCAFMPIYAIVFGLLSIPYFAFNMHKNSGDSSLQYFVGCMLLSLGLFTGSIIGLLLTLATGLGMIVTVPVSFFLTIFVIFMVLTA